MKKSLIEIVKKILIAMDSESVNSITDTEEASMVADICETVFYNLVAERHIPEHEELLKLTAASDSNYPTHFNYPDGVSNVRKVWYQNKDGKYTEVVFVDPLEFLSKADTVESNYDTVFDKNGGTSFRIINNRHPTFYTSFDDYWIVMNAYDKAVDSTLQASKVRAYGIKNPIFSKTDFYVPDIDDEMFPYYEAECTSMCMSLLSTGSDPKVEQVARRQKARIQAHIYRNQRPNHWSNYGRR